MSASNPFCEGVAAYRAMDPTRKAPPAVTRVILVAFIAASSRGLAAYGKPARAGSVIMVPRRAHAFDAPERQTFPRKEKSLLGSICGSAEPMSCLSKNAGSRLLTHTSYFRFTSKSDIREHEPDVCFGSKADMCSARGHVRFTPESDIKCDI